MGGACCIGREAKEEEEVPSLLPVGAGSVMPAEWWHAKAQAVNEAECLGRDSMPAAEASGDPAPPAAGEAKQGGFWNSMTKAPLKAGRIEVMRQALNLGQAAQAEEATAQAEKEARQAAAKAGIEDAMASKAANRIEALQKALKEGVAAEVAEAELARCREAIVQAEKEVRRLAAQTAMKNAIAGRGAGRILAMQRALKEGVAAEVAEVELAECREASAQAEKEARRAAAQAAMEDAMASKGFDRVEALQKALAEGVAAEVAEADLASCREAIVQAGRDVRRAAAQAGIDDAMASKGFDRIEALQKALEEGVAAEVAEAELASCREAIVQAEKEEAKLAARFAIASTMSQQRGEGCVEKLQKALDAGQLAGLERSELGGCEQEIRAAKAEIAHAEAAAEEEAMQARLSEKQDAAVAASRRRSFSSYFFGDPEVEAKEQEAEEAQFEVQAAQQRRQLSQASLKAIQAESEASTTVSAEGAHLDSTWEGA